MPFIASRELLKTGSETVYGTLDVHYSLRPSMAEAENAQNTEIMLDIPAGYIEKFIKNIAVKSTLPNTSRSRRIGQFSFLHRL